MTQTSKIMKNQKNLELQIFQENNRDLTPPAHRKLNVKNTKKWSKLKSKFNGYPDILQT